jgi:hypothetical protein
MARDIEKCMCRKLSSVRELDAFRATIGASLDNLCADLCIRVIKHGDHALLDHYRQNGHSISDHANLLRRPWRPMRDQQ